MRNAQTAQFLQYTLHFECIVVPMDAPPLLLPPQKTCVAGATRLAGQGGCHQK
jgi:hypothetical protein